MRGGRDGLPLGIVFRQAPAEALFFGEVIRVMDRRQICDPFLGFFTGLRVDNVNPEARGQRIEEIHQAVAMILS